MKAVAPSRLFFPGQLTLILLASAIAFPALAQQGQSAASSPSAAGEQRPSPMMASPSPSASAPKEGFWGRVNPFARKKWVNGRLEPLKGQLDELDEVNAKNAREIQDVDRRAQAGIRQAQSSADAASQTAAEAGSQARNAGSLAQGATARVDRLNSTVNGLDQYRQAREVEVEFRSSQPVLPAAARRQLDELAANLAGRQGYILEIEGHSPLAGGVGIQNSGRLTEAVKRYLVTEDEIPIYRMHSVALGNASAAGDGETRSAKANSVRIRLMENSLAAQEAASPQSAAPLTGAERP
jgi:outer membrane protein OmpA-like peptidoglycan-associated protein